MSCECESFQRNQADDCHNEIDGGHNCALFYRKQTFEPFPPHETGSELLPQRRHDKLQQTAVLFAEWKTTNTLNKCLLLNSLAHNNPMFGIFIFS